jgi:hypothetical protein
MALFAISFRVGMEENSNERRESLVARARSNASGEFWEETTSFILLNSAKTASGLASDIYVNSAMNGVYDKLLVVNLSTKEHGTAGTVSDTNKLSRLMSSR